MKITTEQLAQNLGLKPESIRSRVCRTGEYFGLRPEKLVNGRLLWPADSADRLLVSALPRSSSSGS
jgi:hypothetical protein